MKIIKKTVFIFLIILLSVSSFKITKVEAATSNLKASSTEVTVGTTVTITGTVTAGEWLLKISGNGMDKSFPNPTMDIKGNQTASASASFTPQKEGTYTFYLTGQIMDFNEGAPVQQVYQSVTVKVNPKPITNPEPKPEPEPEEPTEGGNNSNNGNDRPNQNNLPSESSNVNDNKNNNDAKPVTKSSNNYLSSISVSGEGKLSPEFYRETYEYTVEYDDTVNLYNLTEIQVEAKSEDDRATVKGAGTINLEEGENNISITVTAENGAQRTYTIKVVKPKPIEQSALRLSTLILNGINQNGEYQTVNFEFDPETFDYNLNVPNEITGISVNPTTENEDIIIEKNGGDSLIEGSNKIIIILTSPSDENIKTTYTLNINREAAIVEAQAISKKQIGIIIIGGIVLLILLIIVIIAIVKHIKKKKAFNYEEDDDDGEIHFINNEEGEDVEEDEEPVDMKMPEMDEESELDTVEDIEPPKLKWENFVAEEEEDEEETKIKKNKKRGRRFM